MSNTFTHHWGGNYGVHVLIQEECFSACISHQSRNFAAVNQNSLSIYVAIIWCNLVMGMAPKEQPPRDAFIIKAKLHLHFVWLPLVSGLPKHLGFTVQTTVEFVALLWYFVSQYRERHCLLKTPTSTIVTTSSRSPLGTLINAAEPCSLPKGWPGFYFCHRRNVIKLKFVSLEHQVYLHTVLSNSGSKLTDRPSYLNHTCRILQPQPLLNGSWALRTDQFFRAWSTIFSDISTDN